MKVAVLLASVSREVKTAPEDPAPANTVILSPTLHHTLLPSGWTAERVAGSRLSRSAMIVEPAGEGIEGSASFSAVQDAAIKDAIASPYAMLLFFICRNLKIPVFIHNIF